MSIGKTEFVSRPYTKEYDEGWECIFGKKKRLNEEITIREWQDINKKVNPPVVRKRTTPFKPVAK